MGFYNGITNNGQWTTILDAGVFRYSNRSPQDYAYAYVYVYGEYNSRRIRLQLKADETGGKFCVYVKVILIEDEDDLDPITQPITLKSGYSNPAKTPQPSDGNASYFTLGSLYQFQAKTAPAITEETPWTDVDVTPATKDLTNFKDGTTNWEHYQGSVFRRK